MKTGARHVGPTPLTEFGMCNRSVGEMCRPRCGNRMQLGLPPVVIAESPTTGAVRCRDGDPLPSLGAHQAARAPPTLSGDA